MTTVAGLAASLTLESAAFVRESRRASDAMNNASRSIRRNNEQMQRGFAATQRAVSMLRTGFVALVGVASVASLTRMAKGALETADAMSKAARATGLTVEGLQELRHAAGQTGVGNIDQALSQFVRRLGEADRGSGQLAKTLAESGISIRNTAGQFRGTDAILRDLAERAAAARDPIEVASLATAAFGREGVKMAGLLREGAAGIDRFANESRRLGQVTTEQAEAAERANDAMAKAATSLRTSFTQAVTAASPQLEGFAFLLERAATGARNFFEELNASGAAAARLEAGAINQQRAELLKLMQDLERRVLTEPAAAGPLEAVRAQFEILTRAAKAASARAISLGEMEEAQRKVRETALPMTEALEDATDAIDLGTQAANGAADAYAAMARQREQMLSGLRQEVADLTRLADAHEVGEAAAAAAARSIEVETVARKVGVATLSAEYGELERNIRLRDELRERIDKGVEARRREAQAADDARQAQQRAMERASEAAMRPVETAAADLASDFLAEAERALAA